jgi:hypothetical protein
MSVALAALGIFVGLGLSLQHRSERRLLAAASLEAFVTVALVAGAFVFVLTAWGVRPTSASGRSRWLGLCASATAAGVAAAGRPGADRIAVRIADLDDVLPIALGGVVLAMVASREPLDVRARRRQRGLGLSVALAGWLLFDRAHGEAERAVFVIGVVALLGGGAAYLGVSPLLSGMVAGLFWKYAPGRADTIIRDDLRRLQHPLVVLLLIFAGASASAEHARALAARPLRAGPPRRAKLAGGWLISRVMFELSPGDIGSHLLAPGVIGLAFALAFHHASGTSASVAVLTAVAAGTLLGELLAAFALVGPEDTLMRRLAALVLLLLTVMALRRAMDGDMAADLRGTALAFGFALIAATLAGELFERLRLPRISGYLLFGLACRPVRRRPDLPDDGGQPAGGQRPGDLADRVRGRPGDEPRTAPARPGRAHAHGRSRCSASRSSF